LKAVFILSNKIKICLIYNIDSQSCLFLLLGSSWK